MNPVKKLHREAMEFLDYAEVARLRGLPDDVPELLLKAYQKEREAAELVKDQLDSEPTRSVLFRSAAALAKRCNKLREAEQLVCMGLAGNPPHEIAEELRDLFEDLNYLRHMGLNGYNPAATEFQMSFTGAEVGHGVAQKDEVIPRIDCVSKNVYRMAQRKRGDSFTQGIPKNLRKELKIELAAPKAASFAVIFRILYIPFNEQPHLPGIGWSPENVIDELMTCLSLLQMGDLRELKARFNDDAYFESFLSLSKLVAPDGERVKRVGFASWKDGTERLVVLDKPGKTICDAQSLPTSESDVSMPERNVIVEGRLLRADSTKPDKGNYLEVVDDNNKRHGIVMKQGVGDIVRTFYEGTVRVKGELDGKHIINAEIEPIL